MIKKFNLLESIIFKNFFNKISSKGKKTKYYKLIFIFFFNFKKKKIKTNIFLSYIISKLKPIFNIFIVKPSKKKKSRKDTRQNKYFPRTLDIIQSATVSVSWFLIPFFFSKNRFYNFNFIIENCFFFF